jgi:hypothetical protein
VLLMEPFSSLDAGLRSCDLPLATLMGSIR